MMRGAKGEFAYPHIPCHPFLFCIFYGNRRTRKLQPSTTWLKFPATTSNDVTYHGLSSNTIHDVATSLYSITFPYHMISHDITLGGGIPAVSPAPPLCFMGIPGLDPPKGRGRGGENKNVTLDLRGPSLHLFGGGPPRNHVFLISRGGSKLHILTPQPPPENVSYI